MTRLFSAYFVGQAVNIILPLRGGELVRIGYFAGEPKILPEIVSTIVLEKYLDLMALTVCGILVSFKISLDNILNLQRLASPFDSIIDAAFTGCHSVWTCRLEENPGRKVTARTCDRLGGQVGAGQSMAEKSQTGVPSGLVDHPDLGQ